MALSVIHSISATLSHILNASGVQDNSDSLIAAAEQACSPAADMPSLDSAAATTTADQPHKSASQPPHSLHKAPAAGPPPPLLTILSTKAELLDRTLTHVEVVARSRPSADAVFSLVADPGKHTEIFEPIESTTYETVSDDGNTVVFNLDYMTRWNFWKFSGVAESKLVMTVVRQQRTVTFMLREPGFLLKYEGGWAFTAEADGCAGITIGFTMQPKLQPPYPINLILKKQQLQQVEGMLQSLAEAADKQPAPELAGDGKDVEEDQVSDEFEPGWVAVRALPMDA